MDEIRRAGLLGEARQACALVQRLAAPMLPDEVVRALEPLLVLYGPPGAGGKASGQQAEAMQKATWAVYIQALRKLPKEALEFAVSEAIAKHPSRYGWPKPDVLLKFADERANEVRMAAWRIRKAAEAEAELARKPTQEERLKVADDLKTLAAEMAANPPKTIPRGFDGPRQDITAPGTSAVYREGMRKALEPRARPEGKHPNEP